MTPHTGKDNGMELSPSPASLPGMIRRPSAGGCSLARSNGGVKAGLTPVQSLAELRGGAILAAGGGPSQGVGASAPSPACAPTPVAAQATQLSSHGAPEPLVRILVVDDNVDLADALARLLRLSGHEVHTAHDGPDAIVLARASHPDVVLLDIGLPGMDGYEAARQIRKDVGPECLLVAITGYGQDDDRRRSREAGFDEHLIKPVDRDALRSVIARATSRLCAKTEKPGESDSQ